MMTNNLMTNRERPARGSQNDPQFIRIFPITCVEPLNTSAASADPTPEVVNTSQPDQQNRVGGSFNTVRYERVCCLTGDKKVDRDSERDDKKVDLLTCDKKVSK